MWYKYKKYIEENEEIRCWFKVSANRKKVWNIQLGLIEEVKRICKKHGLKYYADSGTLLWAIRHKWFIPRDDDTDFVMFREDYDRFIEIAPQELPKNFILQRNHCRWFAKLRNENTVALDNLDKNRDYLGGISLDIFPLDYVSKYKIINFIKKYVLLYIRWILVSIKNKKAIEDANPFIWILWYINRFIFKYSNYNKIYKIYDNLCKRTIFYDKSRVVDRRWYFNLYYYTKDFEKDKKIKFETMQISIPSWYDNILRILYWNYEEYVIYTWWHNNIYSVNKTYKEIFKDGKIDNNWLFSI